MTLVVEKTDRREVQWSTGQHLLWNAADKPIKVQTSGDGFTIAGAYGTPAPLTLDESGWNATVPGVDPGCGPEAPVTETYSGLHPIAANDDGSFVLGGAWSMVYTRTPDASPEACEPSTDAGYIILVPVQALTSQPPPP